MTNISSLQPIDGARTSFTIAKDTVFTYSFVFPSRYGPQSPLIAAVTMTAGSSLLANIPAEIVASLVTGQPVSGYGIPAGATIAAIPSATSVTLSATAAQSSAAIGVTFNALPLDITGISFRQQVRQTASSQDAWAILDMTTDNGLLINGGATGVLSATVAPSLLAPLPLASAATPLVTDIVATAPDGGPINLMAQSGPASVVVLQTVSR